MKGKVVHLPDDIHKLLKGHCEKFQVSMTEFVATLVKEELRKPESRGVVRVVMKKLPELQDEQEEIPAYMLPPFWAMRREPRETNHEQLEGAESSPIAFDEGSESSGVGGEEDRLHPAEDRFSDCRATGDWEERVLEEGFEAGFEGGCWPTDLDGGAEARGGREDEEDLGEEEESEGSRGEGRRAG
jgi:hypothetical protein